MTLVGDTSAAEVIGSLRADVLGSVQGIDALYDLAVADWPAGFDPGLIGVTEIDGTWALIAEINGFVGVTERLIGPMSVGRTIVSHFANVNAVHRFNWWRDGQLVVDFDLLFPAERFGADPMALRDDLGAVGVPLDADSEQIAGIDLSAAGFALAERLTDVACTPELFERSDFVVARVAIPGADDQQRYGEALRAAWCHPATW
ncbi:hypothetical protein FZI94_22725 [Mycobacterium sp. CBMA226]|nr:hypothetical protein [Mycolicibacterium sp. CBMA 226]